MVFILKRILLIWFIIFSWFSCSCSISSYLQIKWFNHTVVIWLSYSHQRLVYPINRDFISGWETYTRKFVLITIARVSNLPISSVQIATTLINFKDTQFGTKSSGILLFNPYHHIIQKDSMFWRLFHRSICLLVLDGAPLRWRRLSACSTRCATVVLSGCLACSGGLSDILSRTCAVWCAAKLILRPTQVQPKLRTKNKVGNDWTWEWCATF